MAETTKVVPLTCHGHSRPVTHLSFSSSNSEDQYYVISACKDNNPMLRDGITGDWIGTFLGHKGAVWQARLSADATLAATGSADFSAIVWDTLTGEALHTLQHNHIVKAVAFPNQSRPQILATGGAEKKLRVFDLSRSTSSPVSPAETNGAAAPPSYEIGPKVHNGTIKSVVWTADPSNNVIVTAAEDKKLRWWDLRARSTIGEYTLDGPLGTCEIDNPAPTPLTPPAANADSNPPSAGLGGTPGAGTLSVAAGKAVYFFDGASPATLLKSVRLPYECSSVAVHTGAGRFVTGATGDTWVRVWDLDGEKELEMGKGHHGPIWSIAFSPDGKLYATGSEDGTVKLWKFTSGPYGLWR